MFVSDMENYKAMNDLLEKENQKMKEKYERKESELLGVEGELVKCKSRLKESVESRAALEEKGRSEEKQKAAMEEQLRK